MIIERLERLLAKWLEKLACAKKGAPNYSFCCEDRSARQITYDRRCLKCE